jgi:hypothetical protein
VPQLPTAPIFEGGGDADTDGNYKISWDSSERAIFYILQESGNSSFMNSITVYRGSVKNAYIYGRPNGVYYYRVKGGNEAGESEWSATRKIRVSISLPQGTITVASSPTGASIYLDDRYRGNKPQTITAVSTGIHTIELRLEGYEGWSESVQVTAGETSYVDAKLIPRPTATPTPIQPTPTVTQTPTSTSGLEQRPTPMAPPPSTPTSTPTPTLTSTSTPTAPPTPPPETIDTMDSTSDWRIYQDDMGSTINIESVPGRTDNGINISYDLTEWGWVGISKKIDPKILSEYDGLRFYYKGSGDPNTIELKQIYEDNTTFGVLWNRTTVADNWVTLEVPYSEIGCWWPKANCQEYGYRLDLEEVRKIEFAISNKEGDVYGSGWVIIDDVQGITSPSATSTPTITPTQSPTPPSPIILTYNDFKLKEVCTYENNWCGDASIEGKAVVYGSMTTDINVPKGASELKVTISICCNGKGEGLKGPAGSAAYIRVGGEIREEKIDSTMPLHNREYYRYKSCENFSNTFDVRVEVITLVIEMSGGALLDFYQAELTFS